MRKANLDDVKNIMSIIRKTIKEMNSYHNNQWDESYPRQKDFVEDIQEGNLYVSERNGRLVAFICVNKIEPAEYCGLNWSSKEDAMVIHRMAVDPEYQRNGVGTELMNFADNLALNTNIHYLKTDTHSMNEKMKALFLRCGYKSIGEMRFLGKESPFYCYDKGKL